MGRKMVSDEGERGGTQGSGDDADCRHHRQESNSIPRFQHILKGINPSLATIKKLCEIYKHPENTFPSVHVAGTNGKGSVCTKLAASLQKEGYVTGLYTSPHISTFRERIRIGGELISETEISSLLHEIQERIASLNISATFFEITTLLAFLYFQRKRVEIAVIETGLGGTWDATNVITPLLSVITSIGYDHTEILGPTLTDIAREKAGIIKGAVPVVLGPDVPFSSMKEKADELGSPLHQSLFQDKNFDRENQETTRLALSLLAPRFPISKQSIEAGLREKPPCRFEHHKRQKEIIFDVAHNAHGFQRLLQLLESSYPNHAYRFVTGFSKEKDISECARLIQTKALAVHLVDGPHPRLAKASKLKEIFPEAHVELSIQQGVQNALKAIAPKQEVVVVTGSFFIMCEARKAIGLKEEEDPLIWYDPIKLI